MTPERWAEIERLYHAALERNGDARAALLADACADDDALRKEVESLLVQRSAAGFLSTPALAGYGVGTTVIGQSLGPYVIAAGLGEGGMGEVYRARDTRLGRDVAIKILPRLFTTDPEHLARFEREARLLAALNHPHIGAIYGLEELEGAPALVLELIDGDTLAERIDQGALPLAEALTVAAQIADALDTAHEKGIVHRDLKPANIKITRDGVVKVLDFGLAKAAGGDSPGVDLTQSPTITVGGTRGGVILGTPAYMSPEQARGKPVDKRTDIWAFGCVLFEMLTGRLAFLGDTLPDTMAAILERQPDWTTLPDATTANVRRLLQRCLEKNVKQRLRDIGDARMEIRDAMALPPPSRPAESTTRSSADLLPGGSRQGGAQAGDERRMPRWIWAAMLGLSVLGLGLEWTLTRPRPSVVDMRTLRLTVAPPPGTVFRGENGAAISPDGRQLAFVARSSNGVKLWMRPLNSLASRELPGTDDAAFPFWSPDSRSIGFFAAGKLKRVTLAGGLPAVICDVGSGRGGTWNGEGVILFNAVNDGPLMRVSATGGTPVPLTTVDAGQRENSHRWPQFLPGGRRFLYFIRGENPGVYLGSLDRPQEKVRLLSINTNAVYAPDRDKRSGHLFWVQDGALRAQPFAPENHHLTGEAITVADEVAFGPASRLSAVSAANDGTLVYGGTEITRYQLTWYDRNGKSLGILGPADEYSGLRISPDFKRLAFLRRGNVWQMDFARGIPTSVTFRGVVPNDPIWSPDGQRIAYGAAKGTTGPPNLFSQNTNGTGSEELLIESHDSLWPEDWSQDGKFLLYSLTTNDIASKTQSDLWLLPMAGDRRPVPFLTTPFRESHGQFSPDGRWIAYGSDESGRNEVVRAELSSRRLEVAGIQQGRRLGAVAARRQGAVLRCARS